MAKQRHSKVPVLAVFSAQCFGYSFTALSSFCVTADAWKSLTDKVQEARSNARLKQLSFAGNIQCQVHFYCASECVRTNRAVWEHLRVQCSESFSSAADCFYGE